MTDRYKPFRSEVTGMYHVYDTNTGLWKYGNYETWSQAHTAAATLNAPAITHPAMNSPPCCDCRERVEKLEAALRNLYDEVSSTVELDWDDPVWKQLLAQAEAALAKGGSDV